MGIDDTTMKGGLAIIFGVDRILDMCRTTTNVTGDCMVTAVVAHAEGELASADAVAARMAQQAHVGLDEHPPQSDS